MEAVEPQVEQTVDASRECVEQEYVGRWNHLVSTTNWQKGEIIVQWRDALRQSGAAAEEYTDEAWSRRVGGVTPQHVGRLRRVHERFGGTHEQYEGLYWSHFHAAVEWPDAEMYLEGAVQNNWSVPKMRDQRKESSGAAEADAKGDASDLEFSQPEAGPASVEDSDGEQKPPATISETISEVRGYDDDDESADDSARNESESAPFDTLPSADSTPVRPFESLPPLPPDVKEAFELMKLAILAHKVAGWRDIDRDDLLSVLASLRQLALAPAE